MKNMFITVLLVCICLISGCSADNGGNENEHVYGNAMAVKIEESGGEDGRQLVWQMYERDGKYYFSADNLRFDRHILQEITEDEYRSVMSVDYDKYFEENIRNNEYDIADDVYHHTTIEFENQASFESDDYYMTKIINQMTDIAGRYDNCGLSGFYY